MGRFLFISQLYTESISDKEIVTRGGFLDLLFAAAHKGFDIQPELQTLGLNLNIPPFLNDFSTTPDLQQQTCYKFTGYYQSAMDCLLPFIIFYESCFHR